MIWLQGVLLGSLLWLGLRHSRRLSASQRFQLWLLFLASLIALPYLPTPVVAALPPATARLMSSAVATGPSSLNLYGPVAALIATYFVFRQFAAWSVWRNAAGAEVRYSDQVASPAASLAGILLPTEARDWPQSRLEHVLRHERAHLERHDILLDFIASMLVAVSWTQPSAWLALYELRRERERAADDLVLESGFDVFEYAETIYQCAVDASLQPAMAGTSHNHLEDRMQHLLNPNAPRRRAGWLSAILFTFALAGAILLLPRLTAAQDKDYDVAPKLIHKVEPQYTKRAKDEKISGTVVLQIRVDTDGMARDPKILRSLDVDLDQQAILAVQQWKLEPATRNGVAVPARATVEIHFRLK